MTDSVQMLVPWPAPVLMLRRSRERWGEALDRLHELAALDDPVAYADQRTALADCLVAYELVEDEVIALRAMTTWVGGQTLAARLVRPIDVLRGVSWSGA